MNVTYNAAEAGATVQLWIERRRDEAGQKWKQMSTVVESLDRIRIGTTLSPVTPDEKVRRLVFHPDEQGCHEEVVYRIQGMICGMDLPPQMDNIYIRAAQNYRKGYLQQSIRLTGFSNGMFQKVVEGVELLGQHAARFLKQGLMADWMSSDFDGHATLDIGNKYFTARSPVPGQTPLLFDSRIDPKGILGALEDKHWVHTDENVVRYYRLMDDKNNGYKYELLDPAVLRKGDIVEAEISILTIPQKKGFRIGLILRSVTLLDNKFAEGSYTHSGTKSAGGPTIPRIKRRAGHEEDIMCATERQLSRMEIRTQGDEGMETH